MLFLCYRISRKEFRKIWGYFLNKRIISEIAEKISENLCACFWKRKMPADFVGKSYRKSAEIVRSAKNRQRWIL
jgi:hypothetical protein